MNPFGNFSSTNLLVDKAMYPNIVSINNKHYRDNISGLYNVNYGYNNKKIISNINDLYKNISYSHTYSLNHKFNFSNRPLELLREKFHNYFNEKFDLFFSTNGSDCVDFCIKISKYLRPGRVISFKKSFHGTSGFSSMCSDNINLNMLNKINENDYLILDKQPINDIINILNNNISCIIIEPVQCSSGVFEFDKEFLESLLLECKNRNIFVIMDEVVTGFGRHNELFFSKTLSIKPDFIVSSKGLNGGYFPISIVLLKEFILTELQKYIDNLPSGFTNSGHPVGCGIILHLLDLIKHYDKDHIINMTQYFRNNFLIENNDYIEKNVRGENFFIFSLIFKQNIPMFGKNLVDYFFHKKKSIYRGNDVSLIIAPMPYIDDCKNKIDLILEDIYDLSLELKNGNYCIGK